MNIAGKSGGSKWHSPSPSHNAEFAADHAPTSSSSSGSLRHGIDGEPHDLPGSHSVQNVSTEYGAGRHEAYDSQLAQPAYSGHGKVQVGKSSAL